MRWKDCTRFGSRDDRRSPIVRTADGEDEKPEPEVTSRNSDSYDKRVYSQPNSGKLLVQRR